MNKKRMYEVTEPTADAIKASMFAQRLYVKRIRGPEDLGNWKRSRAYYDLVAFVSNTSVAIQGYRQGGSFIVTDQMQKLCKIFDWLDRLVYKHHPLGMAQGMMRCVGETKIDSLDSTSSLQYKCHRAFRHWLVQVQERVYARLEEQLKPNCKRVNELAQYLTRSFGSLKTYGYGPENELMFMFFLCGLFKSGILKGDDTVAAALLLFQRYLNLARRLILFYRLLTKKYECIIDNRNIISYLWGCAQLCEDAPFAPPEWEKREIMETHRGNYMLLSSLDYLQKTMLTAPLGVHSYQLWCLLSLSNWSDVYSGLMRTFLKNVLNDFSIVKFLIFSEMMSYDRQPYEYLPLTCLGKFGKAKNSVSFETRKSTDNEENSPEIQVFDLPMNPPLSRHCSLDTDIFMGFQNPRKLSAHNDLVTIPLLRRPREALFNKSSSVAQTLLLDSESNYESADSNFDNIKLSEILKTEESNKSLITASYYSI